jgi:phosphoglycerol transferase MdoB-like AlkP superfamily enzyme
MKFKLFPDRLSVLKTFILIFLCFSFLIRLTFLFWNFSEVDTSFFKIGNTFIIGFLYDLGTVSFFTIPYLLYLLIIPQKWYGSLFDKIVTYFAYSIGLLIFIFSFLAEITFWEEFNRRFNFIAVDYLVYTNEVTKNIQESYPVPLLLLLIFSILFVLIFISKKRSVFSKTFNNETSFKPKLITSSIFISIALIFGLFITNKQAEQFDNRYNDELAKTGIYSFFAAFRNNELSYKEFYNTIDPEEALSVVKESYKNDVLINPETSSIYRSTINSDSLNKPLKPNVIFICIESLSGKYLSAFGSDLNITPNLDSLATKSVFFNNLYATGTRTIRGMEAIT